MSLHISADDHPQVPSIHWGHAVLCGRTRQPSELGSEVVWLFGECFARPPGFMPVEADQCWDQDEVEYFTSATLYWIGPVEWQSPSEQPYSSRCRIISSLNCASRHLRPLRVLRRDSGDRNDDNHPHQFPPMLLTVWTDHLAIRARCGLPGRHSQRGQGSLHSPS